MITLTVVFCLTLNQYVCSSLRFVPEDFREITSLSDCLIGGAIGSTTFMKDHAEWTVKGWRCESSPPKTTDVSDWVEREKARLARTEPQVK